MNPTQPQSTLQRAASAAGAVMTTVAIGLFIHLLARNHDVAAEAQTAARPVIVAHAQAH